MTIVKPSNWWTMTLDKNVTNECLAQNDFKEAEEEEEKLLWNRQGVASVNLYENLD